RAGRQPDRRPGLRFTQNGTAMANFGLAVNQRVKAVDGAWRDGETPLFKVNVWRDQAGNVAEWPAKGHRGGAWPAQDPHVEDAGGRGLPSLTRRPGLPPELAWRPGGGGRPARRGPPASTACGPTAKLIEDQRAALANPARAELNADAGACGPRGL